MEKYIMGFSLKNLSKTIDISTWNGILFGNEDDTHKNARWTVLGNDKYTLSLYNDTIRSGIISLGNNPYVYITISKAAGIQVETVIDWERFSGKTYDKFYDILFILTKDPYTGIPVLLESQLANDLHISSLSDDGIEGDTTIPFKNVPLLKRIGVAGTIDNLNTIDSYLSPLLKLDNIYTTSECIVYSGEYELTLNTNENMNSI